MTIFDTSTVYGKPTGDTNRQGFSKHMGIIPVAADREVQDQEKKWEFIVASCESFNSKAEFKLKQEDCISTILENSLYNEVCCCNYLL